MSAEDDTWPATFDAWLDLKVGTDDSQEGLQANKDSVSLMSLEEPELSCIQDHEPLLASETTVSIHQPLLGDIQTPLEPLIPDWSVPAPTSHTACEPFHFLQTPDSVVSEVSHQKEGEFEPNLATFEISRGYDKLWAPQQFFHGGDVSSQEYQEHLVLDGQSEVPLEDFAMYSSGPDPTTFAHNSHDRLITFDHSAATSEDFPTISNPSTAEEVACGIWSTTAVQLDASFGTLMQDVLSFGPRAIPSSTLMEHQLVSAPQPALSPLSYRPAPHIHHTAITNMEMAVPNKAKRKNSCSSLAETETARLMKRVYVAEGSIAPIVAVFACSNDLAPSRVERTAAQRKQSRQVRDAGGQCTLCWLMKKSCSGQRPCDRCLRYAARSTIYQWTCDVRTKWTDFGDLFNRGSGVMSVTQAARAYGAAVARLKTIPSEELNCLNMVANVRSASYLTWLHIYEERLAKRLGLGSQQQGRLGRLVSTADPDSLLSILFGWSRSVRPYLKWLAIADGTLHTILEDLHQSSASLMLQRAQTAHIGRLEPFESLAVLALVDGQRREACWGAWDALTELQKERHRHLASATATHHWHLAARLRGTEDNVGCLRDGCILLMSDFLRNLERGYNEDIHKAPLVHLWDVNVLVLDCAVIPARVDHIEGLSLNIKQSPCCCNLVSKMVSEGILRLFSCSYGAIRSRLHESPLSLECADGSLRRLRFHFDSGVILQGPWRGIEDWSVSQVFGYCLSGWIIGFIAWYGKRGSAAATDASLAAGVKRSLLLVMIVVAFRAMSLYGSFMDAAEEDYDSFGSSLDAYIAWLSERRRQKRIADDFWRQVNRILCVDGYEYDTESESEEFEADSEYGSSTDEEYESDDEGKSDSESEAGQEEGCDAGSRWQQRRRDAATQCQLDYMDD